MKKFLLIFCLAALSALSLYAQVRTEDVEKSVKVRFRLGEASLDENYKDNKAVLQRFAEEVKMYYNDPSAHFGQIQILSGVSPEGSKAVNDRIAKQRAQAIVNWINKEIKADVGFRVEVLGVDWAKLIELVEKDPKVPYREEVLKVLKTTPVVTIKNGVEQNVRFNTLRWMYNGLPYNYINANIFPELRFAAASCEFWRESTPELKIISETPVKIPAEGGQGVILFEKSAPDDIVPIAENTSEWLKDLTPGLDKIAFVAEPNESAEPRTTSVSLKYYDKVYEIPVEQEAKKPEVVAEKPVEQPTLAITSSKSVDFAAEGGQDVISYKKSVADEVLPVATASEPWIESITPTADGISYTVAANTAEQPRTATITVEGYNQKHEVTVNQAAATPACRPFYMSIKSNMLYDLAAVPNIGVEFYLGKNFSIAGNWHYSWWKSDPKAWYWRTYGGDVAIRYWLGKASRIKPLTGHHLGLYGQMITYDFEVGKKGILADKWSWAAGLEYGYSLPIARRLNIDFTLGAGYHWGLYDEYLPIDGHYVWQATKRRRYLGPTKLEISLVWLIGCGNYNKEKGGKR